MGLAEGLALGEAEGLALGLVEGLTLGEAEGLALMYDPGEPLASVKLHRRHLVHKRKQGQLKVRILGFTCHPAFFFRHHVEN